MKLLKVEPHGTAKLFFLSSAIWFVVAALEGLIDATHLIAPELISNIGFLVMPRVRPMHTDTMIFGFVGSALNGAAFYFFPVLLKTELYSERLGKIFLWIWNLGIFFGDLSLGLGYSQGREYAEWIWPIDVALLAGWVVAFYNFMMTCRQRREKVLYISIWYTLAGLVTTWGIYFLGNAVWRPWSGAVRGGILDGNLAWFYGHGVVGLFLTPLAVAIAYYVIPQVVRAPLYSHTLSLIGFWSILMIYDHIGAHHLLQTATPNWLKVLAISGSIAMIIPVSTVLLNLWLTMRGRLGLVHADIGGKFVQAGLVWYLITCLQGPLQSLPIIQRVTHFTDWVIAHAHMGVLGFSGMVALGGMYFILPRTVGRPLHNPRLADVQYWLVLLGMAGFFAVLTAAGLVQGNSWLNGETVYRTLPMLQPYYVARAGIGMLLFGGAVIGLYNVAMTIYGRRADAEE